MILTEQMKHKAGWPKLIRKHRVRLRETMAEFGTRFGVTHVAVGYWERGETDPPGAVTWWVYQQEARIRAK